MKTNFAILALLTALLSVQRVSAQTVYNINTNTTYSNAGIPTQCVNCTINIANGVTLTVDKNVFLQNVTFNGGSASKSTIEVSNDKITFWSPGAFNNIIANFTKGGLVNSGALAINNSVFTFKKTAVATVYTSISLISSTWKFEDNATMEATGGTFSIKGGSLTIGDGTPSSNASVRFNGAQLSLLDNTSFVSMTTNNNSYFNWSNYNGNGNSITTTNNNMNCGSGKNACSAPVLYGPSSLTASGVSNSAILPVKLTSFSAKSTGNTVVLNWNTAQEINSSTFEIERSIDGLHWTVVGNLAAKGTSFLPTNYTFSEVVKGGSSYTYRLKMIDQDASFEYSSIVKVSFGAVSGKSVKTYPNPASTFFAVDGEGSMQVAVVNMNGAVVKVINNYVANTKVSVSGMVTGNYVVRVVDANGAAQAFKMVVAK